MAGAKRGGGRGREKSAKEEKREVGNLLKCPFSFWPIQMVIKIKPRELLSHQIAKFLVPIKLGLREVYNCKRSSLSS